MPLKLYDSLTRRKLDFVPADPKRVTVYVCGPTVYDRAHIGNARPVVVFDVLVRLLRRLYGNEAVVYARNITDVDDKINAAASARGIAIRALTEQTAQAFHIDMGALGALPPDLEPRVTDNIPAILAMIEALIGAGHAYAAEGHVLFDVPSFPEYGRLSGRDREDMIAGARIEVAPYKRDPADFVLWKPSPPDLPGWDSRFGRGRPGWHIECSAMIDAHLGVTIDIHGGGNDLTFPHHENEIAQSRCAHGGAPLAGCWVHNGMITVDGAKMSKSLGNILTVRDLLEQGHAGEAIRFFLLKTQYRQPLDWTEAGLAAAKKELDGFYRFLWESRDMPMSASEANETEGLLEPLLDDLNTPALFARMHEVVGLARKEGGVGDLARARRALGEIGRVLGVLGQDPEAWLKRGADDAEGRVQALIDARNAARKARNFAEADRIRAELLDQGILLEDGPGGTTWRRAG